MSRRSLLGFLILNVFVTFATVLVIVKVYSGIAPQATPRPAAPPLVVLITNTPDPRGTQVVYVVVTATLQPGAQIPNPNGASASGGTDEATDSSNPLGVVPTLDPALLPSSLDNGNNDSTANGTPGVDSGVVTGTVSPGSNCQTYTIKQGDTAGKIATVFNIALDDLMRANKLKDADLPRLQIGQVLIVPLNGCGLATDEPTATITPTKVILPTTPPTATLAPTAAQSQVQISQVISPGDITSEGVELHNVSGGVIQMKDWTLHDSKGTTFTFPDYRMFPGGRVTIYTRTGTNTPIVLYWGQSKAIWGDPSEQVTVADAKGAVQVTYPLSGGDNSGSLPSGNGNNVPTPTSSN
jgi:LysM repeat protein